MHKFPAFSVKTRVDLLHYFTIKYSLFVLVIQKLVLLERSEEISGVFQIVTMTILTQLIILYNVFFALTKRIECNKLKN